MPTSELLFQIVYLYLSIGTLKIFQEFEFFKIGRKESIHDRVEKVALGSGNHINIYISEIYGFS